MAALPAPDASCSIPERCLPREEAHATEGMTQCVARARTIVTSWEAGHRIGVKSPWCRPALLGGTWSSAASADGLPHERAGIAMGVRRRRVRRRLNRRTRTSWRRVPAETPGHFPRGVPHVLPDGIRNPSGRRCSLAVYHGLAIVHLRPRERFPAALSVRDDARLRATDGCPSWWRLGDAPRGTDGRAERHLPRTDRSDGRQTRSGPANPRSCRRTMQPKLQRGCYCRRPLVASQPLNTFSTALSTPLSPSACRRGRSPLG